MKRGARLLMLMEIVVIVLGLSKVHASRIADPPYDYTGSFRFGWSLLYIVVLAVLAYGVGLPDLARTTRSAVGLSAAAALVAALVISVVQLVTGDELLPRFVVFGTAVLFVPAGVAASAMAQRGRERAEQRDRVVFVGAEDEGLALGAELARAAERPATIVGHLDGDEAAAPGGSALLEMAEAERATVVVLGRDAQARDDVVAQAAGLHERGTRIRTLSLFYEEWLGKLPVSELERVSLFFDIGELHRARYGRLKRIVDVALGSVGLVPFLALVPVVAVGNVFGNRGPVFYRQERVGRGGSRFRILKFRTMAREPGGAAPSEWTSEDDPRITRFGRILRTSHLDELPQVVNILRGDLSVVGPRPEQPRYVEELSAKLPFYDLRHLVRPGLTGWAQVKYGYAGDESDALEKLQYEFFYLRRQSLGFDLRIVGRTVRSVLGREGR